MVRGIREFQEDFRDDRRRQEENQDFRREEQRRQEMERRQEESERQRREDERRRIDAIATVVNDETITIEAADRKIINDPEIMMMPTGEIVRRTRTKRGLGSGAFAQQFSVLGGQLPKV